MKIPAGSSLQTMLLHMGWLGALLILLMYALNSLNMPVGHTGYQLGNFFGASLIAVSSWVSKAWPAVVLNLAWAGIAVYSLFSGG